MQSNFVSVFLKSGFLMLSIPDFMSPVTTVPIYRGL